MCNIFFQKLLANKHYRFRYSKSRPRLGRAEVLVWSPKKTKKKTRRIGDLVTALQSKCSAHSKGVLDDYLITVDATSLDQHKLYYCTIALICCIVKVKTVLVAHSTAD